MPLGSHCGWTGDGVREVTLWLRCLHRKHGAILVASCGVHASLVQNHLSFPATSSLSFLTWISLGSSQLCLCTRSKYLPSAAQIFLPFISAHSWDHRTRELISTTFSTAASSLEHVQFYLIILLPPKHGILSELLISLMDIKYKSLAHFTSIIPLRPSMGREFQGSCCYCFVQKGEKKIL